MRLGRRGARAGRVSVVIPLYDHAGYIEAAVRSVLAQGDIVRELIVLDDGSRDASAAVMRTLLTLDPRVRFERQANAGAHAALNTALSWCGGEVLAILNSDDVYMPGRLAALVALLDRDPAIGIVASAIAFIDAGGEGVDNEWYRRARAFHDAGAELGVALLNGNFVMTTSNLVFRRTVWGKIGGFAALRYVHDLDWLLRALAMGTPIGLLDTAMLGYRVHGANTISEDHDRVRVEWAMAAAAYLTALWDGARGAGPDWDQAAAAVTVLRAHALDRAVALCMAYLRRGGVVSLERAGLLADQAFQARLKAVV